MFTTKNLDVDSQGQEQIATPDTSRYQLRSHNSTKTSSIGHSLPNEESREQQFDIIGKQGEKAGNRLATQDNNTEGNDQEKKDILDSDSSESTNLPSFRCILNEEDPDLNDPNLYNCKTCRKGLIFIRSRTCQLPEESSIASKSVEDDCGDLSFRNNQLSGDLVKNPQNHERYQLKTQRDCLVTNAAPTIFSTMKHLTSDSTSVEFDDQQKSDQYHLQDGFLNIDFEVSQNISADENEKRKVCSVREEGFKNQLTWKELTHKTKLKSKGPIKCKQCPKRFTSKANLEVHSLVHGAPAKFTCEFCQKTFKYKSQFERHSRIHNTDVKARCPLKCKQCPKLFTSKLSLESHTLVHGAQAKFVCEFCQKGFMSKQTFEIHSRIHMTDVEAKSIFKCKKCSKRFTSKTNFNRHMLVHGAQAKFICDLCSKGFAVKGHLRNHLKSHEIDLDAKFPFKCNECLKRFTAKANLESHMLVHGAQAKFICDFCSKAFTLKNNLREHLRSHEVDLDAKCPFKCNKCSKQFTRKLTLETHMLVHGAQAQFFCDSCSKGFMVKCYLRKHLESHKINVL